MKTKLTLRLDEDVIDRAKAYAAARGTSVSGLVEDYFRLVAVEVGGDGGPPSGAAPDWREGLPPVVRALLGSAVGPGTDGLREDGAAEAAYGEYRMRKYG
jgi:hypothetical protein